MLFNMKTSSPTFITIFYNLKKDILINWITAIRNFFIFIFFIFVKKTAEKQHKIVKPVYYSQIEMDKKYIKTQYSQFLNMISYKMEDPFNNTKLNSNIDPLFYKKSTYEELLEIENSELEKQWKTRLLFENTSRGNIIMFFDIYKLGFSYYSDTTIQYNILNAVAMKYIRIFNCFDFFMDTQLNDCSPSPLLILKELIETAKASDKTTIKPTSNPYKVHRNAFVKLKNYTQPLQTVKSTTDDIKTVKTSIKQSVNPIITEPETFTNKFMYLGKVANFNILKDVVKKSDKLVFSKRSQFEKILSNENNIQRASMSYKDFKQK
jgi:hypothetical protein